MAFVQSPVFGLDSNPSIAVQHGEASRPPVVTACWPCDRITLPRCTCHANTCLLCCSLHAQALDNMSVLKSSMQQEQDLLKDLAHEFFEQARLPLSALFRQRACAGFRLTAC